MGRSGRRLLGAVLHLGERRTSRAKKGKIILIVVLEEAVPKKCTATLRSCVVGRRKARKEHAFYLLCACVCTGANVRNKGVKLNIERSLGQGKLL